MFKLSADTELEIAMATGACNRVVRCSVAFAIRIRNGSRSALDILIGSFYTPNSPSLDLHVDLQPMSLLVVPAQGPLPFVEGSTKALLGGPFGIEVVSQYIVCKTRLGTGECWRRARMRAAVILK